jgi:hypothetical protein
MPRFITYGLIVLVSVAWAVNLIIGWQHPESAEPSVNTVFLIIVGALFALDSKVIRNILGQAVRRGRQQPDEDEPDDEGADR